VTRPHRLVTWANAVVKSRWLDGAASVDAMSRPVRRLAAGFLDRFPHPADRARAIQRAVRDRIRYTEDRPTMAGAMGEEFASSDEILQRLTDDCDGKSRLFVALCRASGIESRIRPVFSGPHFVHVQGEARWPGSELEEKSQPGGWLLAEEIVRGVELGDDPTKIAHREIV